MIGSRSKVITTSSRDVYGVQYSPDRNTEGVSSDYGRRFDIQRIPMEDAVLYQTERYATGDSISYDIPLRSDGEYVLVLKFCEVYFQAANSKVIYNFARRYKNQNSFSKRFYS